MTNDEESRPFDYLIIGSGAAGLLLCAELLSRARLCRKRIGVVDDGSFPLRGRGWGYWTDQHRTVDELAESEWTTLDVFANGEYRQLNLTPYRYCYVRAEALSDWLRSASEAADVTWIADRIERLQTNTDGAVAVGRRAQYNASFVFDSRPPLGGPDSSIRLHFLGWEVATPTSAFSSDVATFMDFRLGADGRVQFGYVLPQSPTAALVELASFTSGPWDHEQARRDLTAYVSDVLGIPNWSVTRNEFGDLPLIVGPSDTASDRVVAIGRSGGLLRASTGYGFDRMMRHARQIADGLEAGATDASSLRFAESRRQTYLDRVLLDVVAAEPEMIEPTFAALFARNPPTRILRFLDGESSRRDEARIVMSMPKSPFLRAARRVASS